MFTFVASNATKQGELVNDKAMKNVKDKMLNEVTERSVS